MEKLVIQVCVGSSCHLKGSHTIVKLMKKAIAENNLQDKVELKATFCLGHCTDGPSVKVGDEVCRGQMIAKPADGLSVGIHATICGKVTEVTDRHIVIARK